jgi:hypothetical protein
VRSADPTLTAVFTGTYQLQAFADAWYDGEAVYEGLPIIGGTIEWDADADVQATLTLTVGDPDGRLCPVAPTDPLAVFGQEVQVSMSALGVGLTATDPIAVGRFRIQASTAAERWLRTPSGGWRHGGATVEVTALDRMQILADYRFLAPSQPPAGATVLTEIDRLVEDLIPIGDVDAALTNTTVPAGTVYEEDRVAALADLARSIGGELVLDAQGSLRLRRPTQFGADPVWTFGVGAGGDVMAYASTMTRDGVVNAVVATGETDSDRAPVQGVAYDTDPSSPTRWDGPFGRVPLRYSSPLLTTPGAAGAAARTRLNNLRRGRDREIEISTVPNFLLELDDPVLVQLPTRSILGRVVGLRLPLTPGLMTVTVRALDSAVTEVV